MHSIAAVRSSGGAADYFANDNYYTAEENAEAGVWAGEGARDLGLAGPVERDAFEAILNGHLPDGDKVGQVEGRHQAAAHFMRLPKRQRRAARANFKGLVGGREHICHAPA